MLVKEAPGFFPMMAMMAQYPHTCLKNSNNSNTISPLNLMNGNELRQTGESSYYEIVICT